MAHQSIGAAAQWVFAHRCHRHPGRRSRAARGQKMETGRNPHGSRGGKATGDRLFDDAEVCRKRVSRPCGAPPSATTTPGGGGGPDCTAALPHVTSTKSRIYEKRSWRDILNPGGCVPSAGHAAGGGGGTRGPLDLPPRQRKGPWRDGWIARRAKQVRAGTNRRARWSRPEGGFLL